MRKRETHPTDDVAANKRRRGNGGAQQNAEPSAENNPTNGSSAQEDQTVRHEQIEVMVGQGTQRTLKSDTCRVENGSAKSVAESPSEDGSANESSSQTDQSTRELNKHQMGKGCQQASSSQTDCIPLKGIDTAKQNDCTALLSDAHQGDSHTVHQVEIEVPNTTKQTNHTDNTGTERTHMSTTVSVAVNKAQDANQDRKGKRVLRQIPVRKTDDVSRAQVSVQSIVPTPTRDVVDQLHVSRYDNKLLKRIHTLSSFVNEEKNVYALGSILPTATWGSYQPFEDHRLQLCNPITNVPIVIWIIGHIASAWFLKQGIPEKQAALTVIPLSHSLGAQTTRLLRGLASPPTEATDDPVNAVRAIKWQSSKTSDERELFGDVYDARDVFTNKAEMPPYPIEDLKRDDLVLLESKITRWKLKDANNKWSMHRVQMEMLAVSVLYSANPAEAADKKVSHDIDDLRI